MENVEECAKDDGCQLNRNRSFKSKQLVRSQAIRESTSPPRTISPSFQPPYQAAEYSDITSPYQATNTERTLSPLYQATDRTSPSYQATSDRNLSPVYHATPAGDRNTSPNGRPPYQATSNDRIASSNGRYQVIATDSSLNDYDKFDKRKTVEIQITGGGCNTESPYCDRNEQVSCDARLLSQTPRTACVCGACSNCPQCRGKRRKQRCPTKQDSGIVCSEDCPDCSDTEQNGGSNNKSLDVEDQIYCRCPERRDKPKSISLNRSDSDDKQEPSGPELVNFLKETLNKNGRDRVTLLKIEKELHSLINDNGRCIVKFPVMSSYGRMLVHRCASLFQLSHYLDHYNKNCVVVSKTGTSGGCIPCTSFRTWCVSNFPPSPRHHADNTLTRSILKRDTHSLDEPSQGSLAMNRSKSLEQREKEYERVRRRIFSTDNCTQDESQWPWINSGPVKLLAPDPARNKLLKVQSLEGQPCGGGSWRKPGSVSKSHSFGGYVEHSRTLSRQGDLASSSWRLSPSSSGYKTLSLRSTDSVTPSPTGGGTPEPSYISGGGGGGVVWAVTDMSAVPAGAIVIHPQTGRPLTNPDGSVYHFDPNNPPQMYDASVNYTQHAQHDNKVDSNNEKRRGRLEKQHSFIDNDSECQQTDDCRNKCCCDCQRHENQAKPQDKEQQKPSTPIKNRYENPQQESTNHSDHKTEPTNQSQPHMEQQPIAECETNAINQRQYDQQRTYENNQRKIEIQDNIVYGHYNQAYNEEVTSPPQVTQYIQPADMVAINNLNMMQAAKVTPIQDPNIRPLSLTNMMYGPTIQPGYYIPNHCRMDQIQQPLYQHLQQVEEPKHHQQETAFRIDPSYPYAPLEYATCTCAGAETQQTQRSYSVYNQSDVTGMGVGGGGAAPPGVSPFTLPVHNVLLSQVMPQYPVQYQEPLQWLPATAPASATPVTATPKLIDVTYPLVYPHQYAHYNILYPQMVPQPYPYCPPTVPARPSLPPSRNTPRGAPTVPPNHTDKQADKVPDNTDDDIQAKIIQIKDQMAAMNMKFGPAGGVASVASGTGTGRNSGNGILGSHPGQTQVHHHHQHQHQHQHGVNGTRHNNTINQEDSTQLSSAARAIVNSIRSMQAKNTYQEKPYDQSQRTDRRPDRHDAERKLPYRPPYLFRQMSPGTWCRRSPAPVHPVMNHPRRPHPDSRNFRR